MCSGRDYKGVFLPLDPPFSDRATLGGIIAVQFHRTEETALRRSPAISSWDVRYVAPTGEIIGMGGKTVKNVSGYDVSKIMIGSLGTLGILGDVTCRLLPLPEQLAAVLASFGALAGARAFADRVLNSKLLPTSLEILNGPGYDLAASKDLNVPSGGWCVAVGVEGFSEEVKREVTDLKDMAQTENALELAELDRNKAAAFWKNLADCTLAPTEQGKIVVKFKGSFLISRYAEVIGKHGPMPSDWPYLRLDRFSRVWAWLTPTFLASRTVDLENLARLGAAFRAAAEQSWRKHGDGVRSRRS